VAESGNGIVRAWSSDHRDAGDQLGPSSRDVAPARLVEGDADRIVTRSWPRNPASITVRSSPSTARRARCGDLCTRAMRFVTLTRRQAQVW